MKNFLRYFALTSSLLLLQCSYPAKLDRFSAAQHKYRFITALDQEYRNGYFGTPDPAALDRLHRYQQQANDAVNQCQSLQNSAFSSNPCLKEALNKIAIYESYLNALGATQATQNTFTGF
ncbi:hypothetical protein COMNV_01036 [Commensalibacter sp. Nvir]|uniref:hypothetical protein n=1 Tax=Commensalibacter sp. Nvir TaxID=3069817 RepID=UPI002D477E43|nr:hypothetical protein COMNV_01036 [Commensalibacter sp. Nvir]